MRASQRVDSSVLVSSRRKWLGVLAIGVLFTAAGVGMQADGSALGWVVSIFFGLCSAVAIAELARPSRLAIDAEGMTSTHLWRRDRFEFRDCSEFRAWRNPIARSQWLVVFDWEGAHHKRLSPLSRGLSGGSAALPDTYGLKADELVVLLNKRRSDWQPPIE